MGFASLETDETTEYADFPATVVSIRRDSAARFDAGMPGVNPSVATTPDGIVYMTGGDEYQVASMMSDGNVRWALWVAMPREPYSDEETTARLKECGAEFPISHAVSSS